MTAPEICHGDEPRDPFGAPTAPPPCTKHLACDAIQSNPYRAGPVTRHLAADHDGHPRDQPRDDRRQRSSDRGSAARPLCATTAPRIDTVHATKVATSLAVHRHARALLHASRPWPLPAARATAWNQLSRSAATRCSSWTTSECGGAIARQVAAFRGERHARSRTQGGGRPRRRVRSDIRRATEADADRDCGVEKDEARHSGAEASTLLRLPDGGEAASCRADEAGDSSGCHRRSTSAEPGPRRFRDSSQPNAPFSPSELRVSSGGAILLPLQPRGGDLGWRSAW